MFYNPTPRHDARSGCSRAASGTATPAAQRSSGQLPRHGGPDVKYTGFHYDTTVSETRIASYIAIARGQVPAAHYFGTYRAFPAGLDFSQERRPTGGTRTYLGIDVYEGTYEYRGCSWPAAGAAPCSRR